MNRQQRRAHLQTSASQEIGLKVPKKIGARFLEIVETETGFESRLSEYGSRAYYSAGEASSKEEALNLAIAKNTELDEIEANRPAAIFSDGDLCVVPGCKNEHMTNPFGEEDGITSEFCQKHYDQLD